LAKTIKTNDDEYFHWVLRKWLVSMVACAINEKITNHTALIFSGGQGIGKTSWFEKLLPKPLKPYMYSGNINPSNKDTLFQMSENILINMDEISTFDKNQTEAFKELITRSFIRERRPYDRFSDNYTRRASFVGTTNNKEILQDLSGNRRFLIIETLEIDYLHNIDMDRVFAQALHLYQSGFEFWFNEEGINLVNEHNEKYRIIAKEEEMFIRYFQIPEKDYKNVDFLTSTEVCNFIKEHSREYLNSVNMGKYLSGMNVETIKKDGVKKYILKIK
jgi:predicted P-loop ATPase